MIRDFYFRDTNELREWTIKRNEYPLEMVNHIITHEEAHAREAKRLGYTPYYGCKLDDRGKVDSFNIQIIEDVPLKDLAKIAMAPRNPSQDDFDIFKEALKEGKITHEEAEELLGLTK